MTASRANMCRRPRPDVPPSPLARYRCHCQSLTFPHNHLLGDHPGFTPEDDE